ncbi:MAG: type IV secretory system conjugative DNA transfer family protein [Candidatus Dormibacteria bacterium]
MSAGDGPGRGTLLLPAGLVGIAALALALHPGSAGAPRSAAAAVLTRGYGRAAPVLLIAAVGMALALLAGIRLSRPRTLAPGALGRARAARRRDTRAMRRARGWPGVRGHPQVRLGTYRGTSLWLPPDEHLLALGPTGSGKSSALAIPALLEWPGPAVVTDPKGELLRATAAHRRQLGRTVVFAPLMRPTDCWNPVLAIGSSEDALRTATFLMGKPPEKEPFWHDLARQLLHGLLIEAAHRQLPLAGILEALQTQPAERLAGSLEHPAALPLVMGALSGGERTAMGVVATLVAQLGAYGSGEVADATGHSDFDPSTVSSGGLMTLYCVVAPHDAPVLRGLISALIACCWRAIFAAPPNPPALFVLDEFAQLTNLPELPALAQLGRSQGARLMLLAQDLGSITAAYGAEGAGALWANTRTKVILPGVSELELLDRVSRLAGTTTLHRAQATAGWEAVGSQLLLHPDDVRRLRPGRALVLHGADHPAVIRQRRWFRSRRLRRRVSRAGADPGGLRPAQGRPLRDWTGSVGPDHSRGPLPWELADEDR